MTTVRKIKRGEELPQTKLSDELVEYIRALYESGVSCPDIARLTKISRIHAWRIVKLRSRTMETGR